MTEHNHKKFEDALKESIDLMHKLKEKAYQDALQILNDLERAITNENLDEFGKAEGEFIKLVFRSTNSLESELMYRASKIGYPMQRFEDMLCKYQKKRKKRAEIIRLEIQWNKNSFDERPLNQFFKDIDDSEDVQGNSDDDDQDEPESEENNYENEN